MEYVNKIVDFSNCKECEYYSKSEQEEPCFSCLQETTKEHSKIPVKFVKKVKKNGRRTSNM